MKRCKTCHQLKQNNFFDRNHASADGRISQCKACRVARQKLLRESRSGFDIGKLMEGWAR